MDYEIATIIEPLSFAAQVQLAYSYIRCRRRDAATTILEFAAEMRMKLAEPLLELAVQSSLRLRNTELLQSFSHAGRTLFPDNHLFWHSGGEAAKSHNATEIPEAHFAQATILLPSDARYRIAVGQQQLALRDYDAARKTLDVEVSEIDCLATLQRLNRLYSELDDIDGVLACASELWRWKCHGPDCHPRRYLN